MEKTGENKYPQRGNIFWVNLDSTYGSEINKTRPALIVSNDVSNEISKRVIVAPITSKSNRIFPFEVAIELNGIKGKILLDQIRAIDKIRLGKKMSTCDDATLLCVEEALKVVFGIS